MIKAIIFDLSEVLLKGLYKTEDIVSERFGLQVKNDQWHIREIDDLFHGRITEQEYWQAVIDHYDWPLTIGDLSAAIRENFAEIEGTREIIASLKKQGYKIGLLSIHAKEWIDFCEEKYGYHELFDSISYSFEVAVSKPDDKAYEIVMEKLAVMPEECIFIDDSAANVQAAQKLGIHGIHFRDAMQLKGELHKQSIKLT